MTDVSAITHDGVPTINYDIPPNERDAVEATQQLLELLEAFVIDFYSALELYDFSQKRLIAYLTDPKREKYEHIILNRWSLMAARDGAMTIIHFKKTMAMIRNSLRDAPTLFAQVDNNSLRLAKRLIRANFPQSELMRNVVAHLAETVTDPSSEASIKPWKANVVVIHTLVGRRYTTEYRKKVVSYELSSKSLTILNTAKVRIFSGFDRVNTSIRTPSPASTPGSV